MTVRVLGPRDMSKLSKEDRKRAINVTSSSKTWAKELSPFFVGPVNLYRGYVSRNFENLYQFAKVYPEHVGVLGLPTEDYWAWAEDGWKDEWAHRYPMGKGKKPKYLYWDGKMLGYVQGRRQVYIPLYFNAVRFSDAYGKLVREYHEQDKDLILFDYDAYDHRALGFSWEDAMNCETRKFGHGMVLGAMIEEHIR